MRGECRDTLLTEAMIDIANPDSSHDIVNTQLGQSEGRGVSSVMLSATIGDLLGSDEVAVAFAL